MANLMDIKGRDLLKSELKKREKGPGYFTLLKDELKKVTWTTPKELALCTKIVLGVTFVFGIGIYVSDLAIKGVLNSLGSLFRLILG
jgi:preprotein translocase subunit SecE